MTTETQIAFALFNPTNGLEYPILKDRILVGRGDQCDIILNDSSISEIHAMIMIDASSCLTIIDLKSHNGTYVDGLRISKEQFIATSTKLRFGNLLLEVNETYSENSIQFEDIKINQSQEETVYIPEKYSDNSVLIDDEYCDIVFEENGFQPIFNSPLRNISFDNYIESEELEAPFDIRKESNSKCILISTLVSGSILEQTYLPPTDHQYFASRNKHGGKYIQIDLLAEDNVPFISISDGKLHINQLSNFTANQETLSLSDEKNIIVLTNGTFQIFIELANAPNELIRLPLLTREKAFWQQTTKIFAGVMLPMLLLLLVDFQFEKKKDLKKLSVIYKRATKTKIDGKTHSSTEATNTDKNDGHKKTEQNDKKIARSKQGQKTQATEPMKKVAASNQPKSTEVKKSKAPVKAYKFKMAANVNSMFADGKTAAKASSRSPASIATSNSLNGALDTKVNGTTSNNIGNLGSDLAGTANSFGAKGLSGKKGIDTSYIQTETVILGSMDPELLRKILQQYLPQFRHCYQQELVYNSEDIRGIVDLNFEILGSGKVAKIDIKAKDNRFSKKGINCMTNVLSIIDFPKPKGGGRVAVRQPLNFFSEKSSS